MTLGFGCEAWRASDLGSANFSCSLGCYFFFDEAGIRSFAADSNTCQCHRPCLRLSSSTDIDHLVCCHAADCSSILDIHGFSTDPCQRRTLENCYDFSSYIELAFCTKHHHNH